MHARDQARELGALRTGLVLTALLCVTELVGGWLTNSLALVSDAAHLFTDVAALGLTMFALWIGTRQATETKSRDGMQAITANESATAAAPPAI